MEIVFFEFPSALNPFACIRNIAERIHDDKRCYSYHFMSFGIFYFIVSFFKNINNTVLDGYGTCFFELFIVFYIGYGSFNISRTVTYSPYICALTRSFGNNFNNVFV